jgi:hypothetical protein
MPKAIQGVKTAAISETGWAREIGGRLVIPRERQESPRGALTATSNRIMYCHGDSLA